MIADVARYELRFCILDTRLRIRRNRKRETYTSTIIFLELSQ